MAVRAVSRKSGRAGIGWSAGGSLAYEARERETLQRGIRTASKSTCGVCVTCGASMRILRCLKKLARSRSTGWVLSRPGRVLVVAPASAPSPAGLQPPHTAPKTLQLSKKDTPSAPAAQNEKKRVGGKRGKNRDSHQGRSSRTVGARPLAPPRLARASLGTKRRPAGIGERRRNK